MPWLTAFVVSQFFRNFSPQREVRVVIAAGLDGQQTPNLFKQLVGPCQLCVIELGVASHSVKSNRLGKWFRTRWRGAKSAATASFDT